MANTELTPQQKAHLEEFNMDSKVVGDQTAKFLELVYPSYLVNQQDVESWMDKDSTLRLESMTFFRISSCTADNVDKVFENVNKRFEKLFTALYSIDVPVAYGVVSCDGLTNLVLGVYSSDDVEPVKAITQGMLSGIEIEKISPSFNSDGNKEMSHGILTGVPSLYVKEEKQTFSLSSIMRSLNGQNYSLLFVAKPVANELISHNISELISVRDKAFAVSKRNVARSSSFSETSTDAKNVNDTKNSVAGSVGGGGGAAAGAAAGALLGTFVFPGVGTAVGTAIGGAVGGGLGTIIGNIVGKGKSHSEGYSSSISKAITDGETVSGDIQNGFAIELMNYADNAIERLKAGQNNGIWQTAIAYSAETAISRNIIRACLSGELSKLDSEKLPMLLKTIKDELTINDVNLTLTHNTDRIVAKYLTELTLSLMVRGVYRVKALPNNDFVELLEQTLYAPTEANVKELKTILQSLYIKDLAKYAKSNVSALVRRTLKKNTDVTGTIRGYFIAVSDETVMELEKMVKGGQLE